MELNKPLKKGKLVSSKRNDKDWSIYPTLYHFSLFPKEISNSEDLPSFIWICVDHITFYTIYKSLFWKSSKFQYLFFEFQVNWQIFFTFFIFEKYRWYSIVVQFNFNSFDSWREFSGTSFQPFYFFVRKIEDVKWLFEVLGGEFVRSLKPLVITLIQKKKSRNFSCKKQSK